MLKNPIQFMFTDAKFKTLTFLQQFPGEIETIRKERCAQRAYIAKKMINLPCQTLGNAKVIADAFRILLEKPDEIGEGITVSHILSMFLVLLRSSKRNQHTTSTDYEQFQDFNF